MRELPDNLLKKSGLTAGSCAPGVVSEKGGDPAGVGLAVSRGLVERMHGHLACSGTPQGTRFLIRLPALHNGQAALTNQHVGSM